MKKNGLIWIICGLMVIASCTGEMDNSVYQQKEIELKNFSNTGCKPRTSGSDGSYFELEATKGNMLYVKHINALFNCASNKFEAKVAVDGNSITVHTHLKSLPAKGLLRYIQTCCLKLRKSPSRLSIPQRFRVHSRNRPYCVKRIEEKEQN